jgi:DNA-binding transcriptional MerR regulator
MYKSTSEKVNQYPSFPDKLFYKIGEVSKIVGVEPYVLRYWETEFPFIKPRKSKSGQRVYIKKDIELLLQVKRLLYQERYTIEGVRKKLGINTSENDKQKIEPISQRKSSQITSQFIEHIKKRLKEILNQLS